MKRINYKVVAYFLSIFFLLVCGVFFLPTLRCKLRDGVYKKVGLAGRAMCVIRYDDAGKECSDSSECKGRCVYDAQGDIKPGSEYYKWAMSYRSGDKFKVSGFCEENNNPFDCSAEVVDGYIHVPIVCMD